MVHLNENRSWNRLWTEIMKHYADLCYGSDRRSCIGTEFDITFAQSGPIIERIKLVNGNYRA